MNDARKRVVVVGGGITGLAATHHIGELARERRLDVDVSLIEASHRLGGVIYTERSDGFVLEHGPDSILSEKPWARDLAERLGLGAQMIPTQDRYRGTYVVHGGKLVPVPEGFLMMAPTRIGAFLRSPLFSWRGKARMALDLILPRGGDRDESLASFVRRRFGREALDRIVQPLIGGIYTADPEKLSLAATMPRFLDMEREHRSVIKAMWRAQRNAPREHSGARWSLFFNFDAGTGVLVDALAQRLAPGVVRLGEKVVAIERDGSTWQVQTEAGVYAADAVIIAAPAHTAAAIVGAVSPSLAVELAAIRWSSAAVVLLAYKREDVPEVIQGFGFVVPLKEQRRLIAGSYSTLKYAGRSPEGYMSLRAFVGGYGQDRWLAQDETTLLASVREEFADLLGVRGEPVLTRIHRWPQSMPQYEVGHLDRVARIEALVAALPGIEIAGNAYRGVGIPDCIRDGEAAAARVVTTFGARNARFVS